MLSDDSMRDRNEHFFQFPASPWEVFVRTQTYASHTTILYYNTTPPLEFDAAIPLTGMIDVGQ